MLIETQAPVLQFHYLLVGGGLRDWCNYIIKCMALLETERLPFNYAKTVRVTACQAKDWLDRPVC